MNIFELLGEVEVRTKTHYLPTTDGLLTAISDLLNLCDDLEGEVEIIKDDHHTFEQYVEDNMRPLTPRELGW